MPVANKTVTASTPAPSTPKAEKPSIPSIIDADKKKALEKTTVIFVLGELFVCLFVCSKHVSKSTK